MKKGLVLEGGGMRGIFTCGVLDVLMENDVKIDSIVGVSAGACFGCNYKSGQAGRAIRYNLRFCNDKRYCSMKSLITTGDLFNAEFCYHTVPNELDVFDREAYNRSDVEFYIVTTDMETGKPVYRECPVADDLFLEWVRASASLPMVSKPVEIDGRKYLDGGISDSIPLEFSIRNGCRKNIVVLTQPRDYYKKKSASVSLMKPLFLKYPNLTEAMSSRYIMYNRSKDFVFEKEKEGSALVILPSAPLPVGRVEHDENVLIETYKIGRKAAEDMLYDIKKFLVC